MGSDNKLELLVVYYKDEWSKILTQWWVWVSVVAIIVTITGIILLVEDENGREVLRQKDFKNK